jgi:hypothetical protein
MVAAWGQDVETTHEGETIAVVRPTVDVAPVDVL